MGALGWIGTIFLPRFCSRPAIRYAVRLGSPERPTMAHVVWSSSIKLTAEGSCHCVIAPNIDSTVMSSDFPLYALSEEHQAIREAVRAVADAKIAPYAADV